MKTNATLRGYQKYRWPELTIRRSIRVNSEYTKNTDRKVRTIGITFIPVAVR